MRRRIFSFLISLLFCLLAAPGCARRPAAPSAPVSFAESHPLGLQVEYQGYARLLFAALSASAPRALPRSILPCRSLK